MNCPVLKNEDQCNTLALHPGIRTSQTTTAHGEDDNEDDAYIQLRKTIQNYYLDDPNDEVMSSIVKNSFGNVAFMLTDEESNMYKT